MTNPLLLKVLEAQQAIKKAEAELSALNERRDKATAIIVQEGEYEARADKIRTTREDLVAAIEMNEKPSAELVVFDEHHDAELESLGAVFAQIEEATSLKAGLGRKIDEKLGEINNLKKNKDIALNEFFIREFSRDIQKYREAASVLEDSYHRIQGMYKAEYLSAGGTELFGIYAGLHIPDIGRGRGYAVNISDTPIHRQDLSSHFIEEWRSLGIELE